MNLIVVSDHEIPMSEVMRERSWRAFLRNGTSHSAQASTLPAIIRRCEREHVPYELQAIPGQGYFIRKLNIGAPK